ncbi:M16 family metallopeptidase, partial [Escherichia coli]
QALSASNSKDIGLGFDCRVLYLRAQCAINIESPNDKLNSNLNLVARELAKVRDKGLPEEEFNALVAQKKLELQKLFAAYARADTDILMGQRMRSLQNQQLSNDMALILLQPKGEPEFNMKALQAVWDQIMAPSTAAATTSVATDDVHPEVTDIPPAQ